METYLKTHLLAVAIIAICAIALIAFIIRKNQKDEKPFERDTGESVKNQDEII